MLRDFFRQFESCRQHILFLDYDGTLAPFSVNRAEARPYDGVMGRISELVQLSRSRIVMVSGRSVADLTGLLDLDPLPEIWGSHGWEHRYEDGRQETPDIEERLQDLLGMAHRVVSDHRLESQLEVKPFSLALHWRGMSDDERGRIMDEIGPRWSAIATRDEFDMMEFDGGVELSLSGRNKGSAVRDVLDQYDKDNVSCSYLGDDRTDEDAFSVLGEDGLKLLVRSDNRPSLADLWLKPPGELLDFLDHWLEASGFRS
jgi:trehalose 6-phosphate phosphatase